jgi:anti-sigma B factor antagonist
MRTDVRFEDDVAVVVLVGDLVLGVGDEVLRDEMQRLLRPPRARGVVINLSQVGRLDSSGIGELVSWWKEGQREGIHLKLVRLGDKVRHTLQLSQLLPVLEVFEDEASAIASFAAR